MKLRAWDKRNEIMHYDFQYIASGEQGNDWIVFTSDRHGLQNDPHPFSDPYFRQQLEIMECSGEKDVYGVDVYAGDLFMVDNRLMHAVRRGTRWVLESMEYGLSQHDPIPLCSFDHGAILGNIYTGVILDKAKA